MPSKARLIAPRDAILLLVALALCLAAGAWCDLPLSQALYHPASPFGRVLAAYGQSPGALTLSAAGTLCLLSCGQGSGREHGRTATSRLFAALGIVAHVASLAYLIIAPVRYVDLGLAARGLIALLLAGAVSAAMARLVRGVPARALRRLACYLIFIVVAENLLVAGLKELWGRPRMRMLAATPEATFQPWWSIASGQREALVATGIPAEEFRSFPSGHTASAACAMAIVALPAVRPSLARWRSRIFWLSALVPATVACSRIIMGAHFLSDVTGGFTVTFLVILAGCWLFWRNQIPAGDEVTPAQGASTA
ncbi:phosphatase PAP2 family protein [Collinsella intestinalis]|uniref:phosphatase PAP2 family protein n=1 Tax=Collinsella intestinalis TaxID=147207 RepID=UPI00195CB14C|nr:phosphatase PAP2 family protein [Collinsella intestinalis]MBM6683760.1 phosphatase PAP2 family protein [Collinsella intestinalis]